MNSDDEALIRGEIIENSHHENDDEQEAGEIDNGRSSGDSLGFWAVIFLTVNATLGAGMLNIPYAFVNSGGLVSSSIFHLV